MEWAEDYIRRCLSDIPQSKYRARLQSELADHIAQLTDDLETVGYSVAEAEVEALRQMGEAEALNEGYRAEWMRQPERKRWDISRLLAGCLLAGLSSFCGLALFFGISVGVSMGWHGTSIYSPRWFLLLGAVLYLSAFLPNAIYLREVFRRRRDRTVLTVCGLLLSWAVGKGMTMLGVMVLFGGWSFPDSLRALFLPMFDLRELLWFQWPMIALSLLGCVVLGWLFGRERPKKTEKTKDEE